MEDRIFKVIAGLALIATFSGVPAIAQVQGGKMEPMAGMDMEHMKGMQHDCMAKNKNAKMCDKEMMTKCQMKMTKGDCKKIMDQAMNSSDEKTK